MFTLIKMDLKQRIKSPLTWFIILILCMMSLLNIMDMKEKRLYRPFRGHDSLVLGSVKSYKWAGFYDDQDRISMPKAVYSREVLDKSFEDIIAANEGGDIKEITRTLAFNYLLQAKAGFVTSDTLDYPEFYHEVIEMWGEVSGGIPYEDINFFPKGSVFIGGKNYDLLYAKYYYQLFRNHIEPIYIDDVNNVTYLYNYFYNILPLFAMLIPILFMYNSINKEKNKGSLKLVLTQSISRWRYYISKWVSGVAHGLFTLFVPPILISTILVIQEGYVSMSYPIFYFKKTMTSFSTIPNYFDGYNKVRGNAGPNMWPSFTYTAPASVSISTSPHESVDVIPFYQYLLMVLLLTVLFVAFAVALVQLISAIINKEIISFVGSVGIFVVGTLISSPFKEGKSLNLSPFTMEHGSRIVIGTYNISALGSVLILLGSTALLLVIGCRYFKTKEI